MEPRAAPGGLRGAVLPGGAPGDPAMDQRDQHQVAETKTQKQGRPARTLIIKPLNPEPETRYPKPCTLYPVPCTLYPNP